jgi:hypothetical protein
MNPTARPSTLYDARWKMLAVLSLDFVAMTLNWFDIAAAFPAISTDFHTGISRTAFLISLFLLGYGIRAGRRAPGRLALILVGTSGIAAIDRDCGFHRDCEAAVDGSRYWPRR